MTRHAIRSLVLALLVFVGLAPGLSADRKVVEQQFFAFGDSLGDNGNIFIGTKALGANPAVPPSESPHKTYFNGRFSNGPVAFEYLWQLMSGHAPGTPDGLTPFLSDPGLTHPAVNFAFGGTGTDYIDQTPGGEYAPGLKGQVELFRIASRGRRPSRDALFAVVTGANDYRIDQFNVPMEPEEVVGNITQAVQTLYTLGARHVVVLSLPDLGQVPANFPMAAYWTALSHRHNDLLIDSLTELANQLPKLNIEFVDVDTVFGLLPAEMNRFIPALEVLLPGFPIPMSACLFIGPALCVDAPTFEVGNDFLFWDVVHPMTAAHRILGQYIFDGITD